MLRQARVHVMERRQAANAAGAYLEQVEGGRIQKVEGNKIQHKDQLMDVWCASQIPQRRAVVAVVDEVHHRQHSQWEADCCKDYPVCSWANSCLACKVSCVTCLHGWLHKISSNLSQHLTWGPQVCHAAVYGGKAK